MTHSHAISVAKAVSYRIVGSLTTGGLIYGFTGNLTTAASVSSLEIFSKIVIFYCHERAWHRIGRVLEKAPKKMTWSLRTARGHGHKVHWMLRANRERSATPGDSQPRPMT